MFQFAREELVYVIEFVARVKFHFTLTCFWNLEKIKKTLSDFDTLENIKNFLEIGLHVT